MVAKERIPVIGITGGAGSGKSHVAGLLTENYKVCHINTDQISRLQMQKGGCVYLKVLNQFGPEFLDDEGEINRKKLGEYIFQRPEELAVLNAITHPPVKEEVRPAEKEMSLMRQGRKLSKEQMPKIPVFTLHNNITSMRKDNGKDIPEWFGFDRYRFRMVLDAKGKYVISTPSDMTRLISKEIGEFYNAAAALKRPLIYVGQGYKAHEIRKSDKYSKATGYKEIAPGTWKGYFRYMPKNGMHLQFWIAVSRGCRGYLIYHYQTGSEGNEVGRLYEEDLVDLRGKESWYWKEAGECFKANAWLFPVFSEWCREGKPAASSPTKDVHVNTFILPGYKGRFVLPLNTQIATWDKTNPFRTNANTQLYSDDENLQGFNWSGPRKVVVKLANKGELRDFQTGKVVNPAEIVLPPGQGRVYFQGSKAEFDAVKKHFKL